jgi:hypothetical protein
MQQLYSLVTRIPELAELELTTKLDRPVCDWGMSEAASIAPNQNTAYVVNDIGIKVNGLSQKIRPKEI